MSTLALDAAGVRLGAAPRSKDEAIAMVAALLVDGGHVAAGYAESMLGREREANTYLGEGIAIPHGLLEDRDLILSTGIAVVQVPGGVEWNSGEEVKLVVGIAATSDEHLGILANVTHVLADPDEVARLVGTADPAAVVDRLTRGADDVPGLDGGTAELEGYARADVEIAGASGLHARPATLLVDIATGFEADVRVRHGARTANAKSLASLLGLGAEANATITVLARGPDQDAAVAALTEAVASGLREGEETHDRARAAVAAPPAFAPTGEATGVPGVGASPGIAIGPLWRLKPRSLVVERHAADPAVEQRRLHEAIASARAELRELHDEVAAKSGAEEAAIFRAHEAFLDDPDIVADVVAAIGAGASAGWAWRDVLRARGAVLADLDDPLLAARAADLDDVAQRVLGFLGRSDEKAPQLPDRPVLLVAEDLTPSDTAAVDPQRVLGFVTARGGPTSHTAIIARALGIPAIVGAGPAALTQPQDALAVLDGSTGTLWLGLGDEDLAAAEAAQRAVALVRDAELDTRYEPAVLADGHRVEVVANVSRADDVIAAVKAGAEGVGLMRTEFLFLGRDAPPDEEEQYEQLATMVGVLNGLPLVVRTLDIGGDKNVAYVDEPAEDNPFLGVRGIRLSLQRTELFGAQLRAIYRASMLGPVRIMFPMVSRLEDLDAAIVHAERARAQVGADPIDVGIMIEVPSAAMLAPELAARVQFFSVGTNDLTQYVLAMDRLHPVLAKQADALHPAVLRTIKHVVDAADAAGLWVGVCGGVAGEPAGALILTGLGVCELSVSVPAVAAVKARLRGADHTAVRAYAERALACGTAPEVRALSLP